MSDAQVHLLAEYEPQARLISALAQDAILSSEDVSWTPGEGHAALLISRFRWEHTGVPSRVRSLIVVRNVLGASRLRWPVRATPLELLAMRFTDSEVRFDFADGVGLMFRIEKLRVALEDMGDPWTVRRAPRH